MQSLSTREAILAALDGIAPPAEQDGRAVVQEVRGDLAAVGRDSRGWATLLLPPVRAHAVAVRLQNLEFDPISSLLLCTANGKSTRVVRARLACRADSRTAVLAFCSAAAALADEVASDQSTDVAARVAGFIELFRKLTTQVASPDVLGLWGELALIAFARTPSTVASAWHADPQEVIDFEISGSRVEAKTTRDTLRAHWFSLDQLRVSELADVTVASIIAVPSQSGLTVADLLELAAERLAGEPDLADRVVDIATRTVGDALSTNTARFDEAATLRSLRLYSFADVPHVLVSDERILDLRWRASLDNAPALESERVRSSRLLRSLPKPGTTRGR